MTEESDMKTFINDQYLKELLEFKKDAHKANCYRCGKEYTAYTWYKNVACYVCEDCLRKDYEEHPMSRKDLLDDDSVKVLEQFESVCKKDLTDAEFRKEINDIIKSYTDKIPTEFFFGGSE